MRKLVLAIALLGIAFSLPPAGPSPLAQETVQGASRTADQDALRKLKTDVVTAINTRDLGSIDALLHKPFLSTVITQDSFNDSAKLKAYFEDLFTRRFLRIAKITMVAEADEPSQIYTGTFAVARGGTTETYELADGRSFTMPGRWTATTIKDGGRWTVLTVHTGTNFLDNPVLHAAEKSAIYFAAGGVAVGVLIGFLLGFFVRRRRTKPA